MFVCDLKLQSFRYSEFPRLLSQDGQLSQLLLICMGCATHIYHSPEISSLFCAYPSFGISSVKSLINGFEDVVFYSEQMPFGGRMFIIKTSFRYFCVVGEMKKIFSCIKNPQQFDGEFRVHTDFSQWQGDLFWQ